MRPARRHPSLWPALAGILVLSACADDAPTAASTTSVPEPGVARVVRGGRGAIPDQYIVVFRENVRDVRGQANALLRAHGGTPLYTYEAALKGFAARFPAQAIEGLRRNPNVLLIEEDVLDELPEPDDEVNAIQDSPTGSWGIDRVDQRDLPLNDTYTYANDGAGVTVYIIDSGIRYGHTEFGGRASLGIDLVPDGIGAGVGDCNGHGTHVAGTVGGRTVGIAKGVALVSVRIFPCSGGSPRSRTIASVDWVTATATAPAVVNMSLGGNNEGFPGLSTLDMAVENSIAAGFVYAVAAGNESTDACTRSPARAPNALTIGSTNAPDVRRGSSNFGTCVDLFAPGGSIRSAGYLDDVGFRTISGTSMAAPHVAGAAALHLQLAPNATPAQVASAILANATVGRLTDIRPGSPNLLLNTHAAATIAIRPAGETNAVNLTTAGALSVAVLSTADFDATRIDASHVTLGDEAGADTPVLRRRNGTPMTGIEDVNVDGRPDMVLHFAVPALVANGDLTASSTSLVLNGRFTDLWPFRGLDAVRIVP